MNQRRNSIRVGVVGTGRRAASYFTHIPEDLRPAVRLAAMVDPRPEHRASFAALFGSGDPIGEYESAPEMFRRADLDAVILAPPNLFHAEIAELALASGVAVLL
jgi:predicted dehydrogenase